MKTRSDSSHVVLTGFILAVLSGMAAILSGFGTRWGWWHFQTGFLILRLAAYGGIASAVIAAYGLILTRPRLMRRSFVFSIAALLIGLVVTGIPVSWLLTAKRVPPIHDISTDTENPPAFVSILPLRKEAPNPAEYGGPIVAAQQHAAYPGVAPAVIQLPPDQVFERTYRTARKMGWSIVDRNPTEGRIEATDTTLWFGFKDDIVIRITPAEQGSRVDVRSVSRVGKSDVGTNARRIRKFLETLLEKE